MGPNPHSPRNKLHHFWATTAWTCMHCLATVEGPMLPSLPIRPAVNTCDYCRVIWPKNKEHFFPLRKLQMLIMLYNNTHTQTNPKLTVYRHVSMLLENYPSCKKAEDKEYGSGLVQIKTTHSAWSLRATQDLKPFRLQKCLLISTCFRDFSSVVMEW